MISMVNPLNEFFNKYFLEPWLKDTGYNLYNTTAFAVLLALFLVYFLPKLLKKLKIKFDQNFILATLPFAIFGAILRHLNDLARHNKLSGIFGSSIFVSPTIWVIGFLFGISSLLIAKLFEHKFRVPYHKTMLFLGIFLSTLAVSNTRISNFNALIFELTLFAFISAPFFALYLAKKFRMDQNTIFLPLLAQNFDSTTTFSAAHFWGESFFEKHVIPRFFIENFGPFSFIILKIAIILPILYYINAKFEKEEKIYYSAIVGYIGLITGLRDFLSLIAL